jgi:hypothetical protein
VRLFAVIPFLTDGVAAIVWTLANIVYVDLRRQAKRGFGRFASFWAGWPGTMLALFAVREGSATPIEPPPDDEARLLEEVRADRERRALGGGATTREVDGNAEGGGPD